ncbi:MAG: fibronectin type III domain-containing protein [Paludibacteraceae bacterium]|nr:fibronectin type III domain-containing protein [Paludibacteraceae bacterium]
MKIFTPITVCLLLLAVLCKAEDYHLITICANGVKTTYALTSVRKVTVEDKNAAEPKFKVTFNNGAPAVGNLRAVAVELDQHQGGGDVDVSITDETATITWPKVSEAVYYQLKIYKGWDYQEVLYTFEFNSDGSLRSTQPLSFTVTGLEPDNAYAYSVTALGSAGQILDEQSGVFSTLATSTSDGIVERIQVYSCGKRIVVDSEQSHNISLYNTLGVQLGDSVVTQHCECTVTLPGVYIIRVDNRQYKIRVN